MKYNKMSAITLFVLSLSSSAAFASDQTLVNRANNSTNIVNSLAGTNAPVDAAIPRDLFKLSVCIVTIPNYTKAGFFVGGSYGAGVAACRNADGQFGTPFFVTLGGGSFGFQFGAEATNLVLVMTEQNAQNQLLGVNGFKLGLEGSIAAGPLGRDLSAGTNTSFEESTLSYSTSRGLFAGASLTGSFLNYDADAESAVAGDDSIAQSMQAYQAQLNTILNNI